MNDDPTKSDVPMFSAIGATGLKRTDGFIDQEWLRQLSTPELRYRAYSEMRDNDATIGAILYAIETLIRQVEWKVVPSEDSERGRQAAAFLESCITDMNIEWEALVSEILTMLPYGYSLFEVVYKMRGGPHQDDLRYKSRYNDGRIGWRKISIRGQDTIYKWHFSDDGTILGCYQMAPPDYEEVYIPMDKCLLFRTKSERNNPEGRSLLRNAYRSWYFTKRLQEIEAIGVERDLAGLPVMHVPPEIMSPSATSAQQSLRSSLEQVIQQIRRDEREGIVMPAEMDRDGNPTGFKLSLLSTGGSRQLDTDQIIKRYESRIAMSVLAEFIMLGMDKTGSFALADSKTDLFATSLRTILETIKSVFNAQAIKPLYEMNPEFEEHCWAELTYGDVESQDLDALGRYISNLANVGLITPDPGLEDVLREQAALPLIAENGSPSAGSDRSLYSGMSPSPYGPEPIEVVSPVQEEPAVGASPEQVADDLTASMVEAMIKIIQSVHDGTMTPGAAKGLIRTAVPGISESNLAAMLEITDQEIDEMVDRADDV